MNKEIFVFNGKSHQKVRIRNYTKDDFDGLIRVQQESYPPPFPPELWWNQEQLENHCTLFPKGALCVEVDGRIAGSMTGLIVPFDPAHPVHTWEEVTDNGYIRNHNPQGDTLYVVDISVSPLYRQLGLGRWLMFSMYEVVIQLRLKRLLGGSRMPGYHKKSKDLTAQAYVEALLRGDFHDPVVSFLLRCGRMPIAVIPEYLEDEESCNYAVLMEWRNPFIS
ncbi:GNAT family N-acetyltransferase [Heliorestis convoluta]|uniref:GNAT family N-acetyltransferase n=1 Tax=Heliorestis convoluta TaxID=356322 RepID=A0A5Q2N2L6_9FIRM|nr:GNAT family N-acetyltransferase [Heliorestis convoluta]QGG49067.1 GNAT family N-acetyltransferase [Heliorestis convoluta]